MRTSSQILNRQYYFDEGLGESLSDHILELKEKFPGVDVQTKRDNDGLAIVTMNMKPQFKYNLDEILALNPEELKQKLLES